MKTTKYFSAAWCGPCKVFKPVMKEIANEGHVIEFIDIDKTPELAQKYGVRSVPTTIIEQNGTEVDRIVGTTSKEQVLKRING